MKEERHREQRKAADIGQNGYLAQLDFSSSTIKNSSDLSLIHELTTHFPDSS